jgi:membrane-bound lytic murein transglycosylase D
LFYTLDSYFFDFLTMQLCSLRASQIVIGLAFFCLPAVALGQFADEPNPVVEDSLAQLRPELSPKTPYVVIPAKDSEINERLSQLSGCVEMKPTAVVKSYIRHYLYRPEKTRRMLGKRTMYFHFFEEKLKEYGLPTDLKYLAVVESALNPTAVSSAGASGLWQFMPATGTDYGLHINSAVDERNNVIKSTDAAARYLKHLYAQFGDWALALAAYNSGPTRVQSAIRRSGSRNFWVLQRFLPEETRNYVPAFVASTYLCAYFGEHGIKPDYPALDAQVTDDITIYEGLSFSAIANATGLTYDMVSMLNPGFRRSYVPPSTRGYAVVLPRRVMPAFIRHLNSLGGHSYKLDANEYRGSSDFGDGQYYMTQITPHEADYADRFAEKLGVSGAQLRAWNDLQNQFVYPDSPLKIWNPVLVQQSSRQRIEIPGTSAAAAKTKKVDQVSTTPPPAVASKPQAPATPAPKPKPAAGPQKEYQWHVVRANESMNDISRRYSVSMDALMALNNTNQVKAGDRIKIKEIKK